MAEKVSATTLAKVYDSNPSEAKKMYEGKNLQISGKILGGIMVDSRDWPVLDISPKKPRTSIKCFFTRDIYLPEEVLNEETGNYEEYECCDIDEGRRVTIEGYVEKVDTSSRYSAYKLTDCKLVSLEIRSKD